MNYRWIYPVFSKGEEKQALDYIVDNMDMNLIDLQNISKPDKSFLRSIVKNIYGVNIVRMANYMLTQEKFEQSEMGESLIKYLDLCGTKAELTYMTPSTFIPYAISKLSRQEGFKPLVRYDPSIEWTDLEKTSDLSVREYITNPLNGLLHTWITIYDVYNLDFLKKVYKNTNWDDMLFYEPTDVVLRLLPSENFKNILLIANLIHKFF